ncbi:hypothetical protein [Dysgonomonas sp. 25]|uniref:hypothetical protein n=1 Tax=Dysgonomonas sp. 25 TaxID=2302933 RepID=UPI0013D76186|nr:hypothetical protein [Dysgonomonas sp. 25]NDV69092.1 hypothetical protein [Dysgonomonas sp. 25]
MSEVGTIWWFVVLLFYPLLGIFLAKIMQSKPVIRKIVPVVLAALSVLGILGCLTGITTTSLLLDFFILSSPYLLVFCLLWWTFFTKRNYARWLSLISVVAISLIGIVCDVFLYAAAAMGESIMKTTDKEINPPYSYKETFYIKNNMGGSPPDYRYRIEIYKTIPHLPILEKKIAERNYSDTLLFKKKNEVKVEYKPDKEVFYLSVPPGGHDGWSDVIVIEMSS